MRSSPDTPQSSAAVTGGHPQTYVALTSATIDQGPNSFVGVCVSIVSRTFRKRQIGRERIAARYIHAHAVTRRRSQRSTRTCWPATASQCRGCSQRLACRDLPVRAVLVRPVVLRREHRRPVSPRRGLRRSHPPRRAPWRPRRTTADCVRVRRELKAARDTARLPAARCGAGDRVGVLSRRVRPLAGWSSSGGPERK